MAGIDDLLKLVAERRFDEIEDLWTDIITDDSIELDEYLSVTDAVHGTGDSARAALLLELVSDYLEAEKQHEKAIKIQKKMLRYQPESSQIRNKLISLYRKQYKNSVNIEEYLQYSGLSGSAPIMKAIQNFEDYVCYDVGSSFYFERYGMGKVVAVIPGKREIVVDFEKKKQHFLTIDIAKGLLTPITEDHFLYAKYEDSEKLKSLALERPVDLVLMILRSFPEPMSASRIKEYLRDIINEAQLGKFWERVRKHLEKHDNIRVVGKTSKTYSYVDSVADKESQAIAAFNRARLREKYELAEEYANKMPRVFEKLTPHLIEMSRLAQTDHPGIALEILMLFKEKNIETQLSYSIGDLLGKHTLENIIKDITNPQNGARFLSYIKDKYPDTWPDTASTILLVTKDFKIMDAVSELLNDAPDILEDLHRRILAMPKVHQKQFHWMLKKIESGALNHYFRPDLLPRFINSPSYVEGVKATMKKILTLKNFDDVIARANSTDAQRIHESIKNSVVFNDHEKSGYLRILEHYFPALAEDKTDIIYSTQTALTRKKKELEHILTVEIPENKKEISRAREFGDLSENFEYKSAKEKQDQLYAKVKNIEEELARVRVIDPVSINTATTGVGTEITLQNTKDGSTLVFTILGRWDTDLSNNVLSNEAPLAQNLLGKKIEDVVNIKNTEYRILEIKPAIH